MKRIVLAAVPDGMPQPADFRVEDAPDAAAPPDGVLIRTTWLSVDPYMRGLMSGRSGYMEAFRIGEPLSGGAIGEIIESRHPDYAAGDIVNGMWAWQEFVPSDGSMLRKLDPSIAPVQTSLGILGMPGMTAYFGLTELCSPKAGETVVISGAAGAVGSAAGQIAKILGCRVVGVAGSAEKVRYVESLGFDAAFDYKTDHPYREVLARLCPNGIDCYFDNVGGEVTDAVLHQMNTFGRIAICGQISQYNTTGAELAPRPFWLFIVKQLRAEGFLVSRWFDRWPEGVARMAEWLRAGKLKYEETVYEGFESAPRAFIGLFTGENTGKSLVRL